MTGCGSVCPANEPATQKKILVVEDEVLVRLAVAQFLRELGYAVVEAIDAAEAMRVIRSDSAIVLVFTDVTMPGEVNGRDLAHWLASHYPRIKVLLTSGIRSEGNGTLPFLVKPYHFKDLEVAVARLLAS
jgi:DNA-binding NtrC family response regulator